MTLTERAHRRRRARLAAVGRTESARDAVVGRTASQAGTASLVLPMLLWVATLVAIVVIDVGAYLVAAARGQVLADASALAAVSADVTANRIGTPHSEATRVAVAGRGRLEVCDCPRGRERATVTVSVEVPGLLIPRLGANRVAASASAILAPPEEHAPGPTRDRARWSLPDPP